MSAWRKSKVSGSFPGRTRYAAWSSRSAAPTTVSGRSVTEVSRSSHSKLAVMFGGLFLASCTAYDIGPSAYYPSEGYYPEYSYPTYGFPTYDYPAYGPSLGLWGGGGWEDADRWRRERSDNHDRDQCDCRDRHCFHGLASLHCTRCRRRCWVHMHLPESLVTSPTDRGVPGTSSAC